MFCGFDYGTSNCAIGVMNEQHKPHLLPLENNKAFVPSTLYAIEREFIVEYVGQNIAHDKQQDFLSQRQNALYQAQRVRNNEGIGSDEQTLFFGKAAFDEYLAMPSEGYFIKSPKSFLGASGLKPQMTGFFEDIVSAMMMNLKQKADQAHGELIRHTVIGRPVNFQGLDTDKSNAQALSILTNAAKRAGFESVEFQYEPIAAGLSFESQLKEDKTVLVMDIGGGTTDCAMVRMGPSHQHSIDRSQDFLGHTGERVGGNDLDIQLAGKQLMPLFGMQSMLKSGLPMPTLPYWNAVTTNDAGAQSDFYDDGTGHQLSSLLRDTLEPEKLERFIQLRNDKQNYQVVKGAEETKIALSSQEAFELTLALKPDLSTTISLPQYAESIERPIEKMLDLMSEAITQAQTQPDLIFMTGGSAQSQLIRQAVSKRFGSIELLDGDHFGSVTAGLTEWAAKLFR